MTTEKILVSMKTFGELSPKDIQDIEDSLKKHTKFDFVFIDLRVKMSSSQ